MTNLPQPKPGIMSIIPYVPGKSKTGQNAKQVIKLSSNENTLGASPKALEAFALHAEKLFRYPDGNFVELRKAIAEVHNLDYEKIVCGAGSDELIGLLVHAYAGQGDEVLYSQYGFLMYKIYAQGAGAEAIAVPEKDLRADVDAIIASVTPKTKIVFIANPNNPTGSYLTFAELERLHQGLPSHVVLVIDEAYAEYADKADYSDARKLVESSQNVVMLRTFSKIYGLASLRLGWGYVPSNIADALNRLRGPFSVSGVAQIAGIAAIKDVEYTEKCKNHNSKWLKIMSDEINSLGFKVHESIANFILVEFSESKKTSSDANKFLLERGIIVREVASYGLSNCLRITIGTDEENQAVLDAFREYAKVVA